MKGSARRTRPSPERPAPSALAVAAHPDDIEFYMAGTLLLLRRAGWDIHYLNLSSGSCGSSVENAARTRRRRLAESRRAAALLGATHHPGFADDLEILYELPALRRLAAVMRAVAPTVVLTHSPQDYMEDHTNTCRLAVTAAFARGMPNFRTTPPRRAIPGDVTLYHAMPHGLRDSLRRRVVPGLFVNTTAVHAVKRTALAAHASQKAWLDASQGMDSYLRAMDDMSRAVGRLSRRFQHAEGWRRHLHLGFSAADSDPLRDALGRDCLINQAYEHSL
jgi:LmbE family N-acetylglucosaminyl deacetylase